MFYLYSNKGKMEDLIHEIVTVGPNFKQAR